MNVKDLLKDKVFLLLILFGVVSFFTVGTLFYYSVITIAKDDVENTSINYKDVFGEWTDFNNNLIRFSNRGKYTWYQDYYNDKKSYIEGEIEVISGNDALVELDINLEKVKELVNMEDISNGNIYYIKMFTKNKSSYYKMLAITRDEELVLYNYNDKLIYQLNRNK